MPLPGSQQLSYGKKFIESLPWTQLKPAPETVSWMENSRQPAVSPQACGIGDRLRLVYAVDPAPIQVVRLRPAAKYKLTRFDPVSGERSSDESVAASERGELVVKPTATDHDWVLLLERASE